MLTKCAHLVNYEYNDDEEKALKTSLDYMIYFLKNCTQDGDASKIADFDCAYEQMDALGIPK